MSIESKMYLDAEQFESIAKSAGFHDFGVMGNGCYADDFLQHFYAGWEAWQASRQEFEGEAVAWGLKPYKPGRYLVRGFNDENTEAMVSVVWDSVEGELICNLHDSNSDGVSQYGSLLSEISDDFEWAKLYTHPVRADDLIEPVAGEMVSIDVSTCDEDNGNRVFGEIVGWQDDGDGKRIWLCSLDHFNYTHSARANKPADTYSDIVSSGGLDPRNSFDKSDHWAAQSPGLADQYRQEAFAAREALGFSCDSLEVSPADIRQAIADKQAVSVPEGWIMKRAAKNRITIECEGVGFYVAGAEAQSVSGVMLYALADALMQYEQEPNQ